VQFRNRDTEAYKRNIKAEKDGRPVRREKEANTFNTAVKSKRDTHIGDVTEARRGETSRSSLHGLQG
jgi:hypothetical protein